MQRLLPACATLLLLAACPNEPCKVGGKTYSSGQSGIADDDGCNVCECNDGKFSCTAAACAEAECTVEGRKYPSGSSDVPAPDGCNTCTCEDGELTSCTEKACGGCTVQGRQYPSGSSDVPAPDGCNTCLCADGELTACTDKACAPGGCTVEGVAYAEGAEVPSADCNVCFCSDGQVECTAVACEDVVCVGANGEEYAAGEEVPSGNACQLCTCRTGEIWCNPVDDCNTADAAACVVGGTEYPSGTAGIKDPFSCNECVCNDGQLACDTADCAEPCPPNAVPGTSCARCGPTDACEAVETGCLIVCDGDAEQCASVPGHGMCQDNACRNICG